MGEVKLLSLIFIIAVALVSARIPNEVNKRKAYDGFERDLPDIYMDTPELIEYYGYPVEKHVVETEDGYLLTMHRIPHGKDLSPAGNRSVVYLQHGLSCSSSDWVIMGPGKGLAYILADEGYDVWMGNIRGNLYSRAHAWLSPEESTFWQFTWDQMGRYDLPAQIDHILNQTGHEQLFYVGHSMGTTMFYVMGAMRPEYNSKIIAQFSLAPVGFMGRLQTPISYLAKFVNQLEWIADKLGINEFLPNSDLLDSIGATLCKDEAITQSLCSNILFLLCGYDSKQLNDTMIPVIIGHVPAGTSTKTIIHYAQEVNSGRFSRFDYGKVENLRIYGQEVPPDYNLSLVTAPIYLHYAENDWLANVEDVMDLSNKLPNVVEKLEVSDHDFNHLDFLWAIDVKELVYNNITMLMKKHLNSRLHSNRRQS
ncbi:lipase 3-like [Ischnura elegans]|uniref:lipase 3-like n=1 Tax=Ischnura elegans TaxID=197161 RepID=UPI001ED87802|nr:lipase 3-like [Ischnura elegans]